MEKGPHAYRTISEVSQLLNIPQHVLRFWETRFPQVKPLKRGGGRRYYRPSDVELIKAIHHLLYHQGYKIKGVQKLLKEKGAEFTAALSEKDAYLDIIPSLESIPGKKEDNLSKKEVSQSPILTAEQSDIEAGEGMLDIALLDTTIGEPKRDEKDKQTLLEEVLLELIACKRMLEQASK